MIRQPKILALFLLLTVLVGCQSLSESRTRPAAPLAPNWVQARGYAPISGQPGNTLEEQRFNAMRVSRLRAYQELLALINGQYLSGVARVEAQLLETDRFQAAVAGVIRGARVVESYPQADDTYVTVLEVDLNQVDRAWRASPD